MNENQPYYDPDQWRGPDGRPIMRPILCLDFDGVLHSYTSDWQGTAVIPDPPVEGAFEALYKYHEAFDIYVFSARSSAPVGVEAMRNWMARWDETYRNEAPAGERPDYSVVDHIHFVTKKPPAHVTLDDRVITFKGKWPSVKTLQNFKPWNAGM